MSVRLARVGEIAEQIRGVSYTKGEASPTPRAGYLPVLRAGNITDEGLVFDDLVFVPESRVSARQRIRKNDVLVAASSGSLDVVGKAARASTDYEGGFGAFCKVLRPSAHVDPSYFAHFFRTPDYRHRVSEVAAGININNLRNEDLDGMQIPLPLIQYQRRIAAILDRADALRARRRAALAQLDTLAQAIFVEMFGDPAINPVRWVTRPLHDLADRFSDGPFGSNLKTEHYTGCGVRVIRLQNIGVGTFIDEDAAYVSEAHFGRLKKHECRPGDVLVATLGDPNLRACIQPGSVPIALNKADCIQLRPKGDTATAEYLVALLNHPSTIRLAQGLMHGQTRVRISMGQLRHLAVPVPPLERQLEFAARLRAIDTITSRQHVHFEEIEKLFASLQHRAFRGEL